jgi:hypothetical protein
MDEDQQIQYDILKKNCEVSLYMINQALKSKQLLKEKIRKTLYMKSNMECIINQLSMVENPLQEHFLSDYRSDLMAKIEDQYSSMYDYSKHILSISDNDDNDEQYNQFKTFLEMAFYSFAQFPKK